MAQDTRNKRNEELHELIKTGTPTLPEGYRGTEHHGHDDSFTTVREARYRGREIRVETTYRITIDDEPLATHVAVMNDGTVHCHGLPNYSFPSAIDMARALIDASDIKLPANELDTSDSDHSGGHH